MQLHTEKDHKEIKKHGNYEFPVHISLKKFRHMSRIPFPGTGILKLNLPGLCPDSLNTL